MPGPFNWSRFNNRAADVADGEFLLFLNDDIEIMSDDWLDAMLEHAQRPEVGIVGARLLYPDRQACNMPACSSAPASAATRFASCRETDPAISAWR